MMQILSQKLQYFLFHYYSRIARRRGIKMGDRCCIQSLSFSTEPYLIEFGDHVCVSRGVSFSTHDGGVWVFRDKEPNIELFGKIKIGNNVFIGMDTTILFNTVICDNTIVMPKSLVKGTFEANSVIAGVPAKRICSVEEYYEQNKDNFLKIDGDSFHRKQERIIRHLEKRNNAS